MEEVNERRLYVGGLAEHITKHELDEIFRRFGQIVDLWICARNQTKFAFIEFENIQDAVVAIEQLNGSMINDKRLIVAVSKKRKVSSNECFNCGGTGHFARECQEKTRKRSRRDHSSSSSPKNNYKMSRRDRSNSRGNSPNQSSYHSRINRQGYNDKIKPYSPRNQPYNRSRRSRSRSDGVESCYSSSTASSAAHGDSPSYRNYRKNFTRQSRDRAPSVMRNSSKRNDVSSVQVTENSAEERWSLSPQKPSGLQIIEEKSSRSPPENGSPTNNSNAYQSQGQKDTSPSIKRTATGEEEWDD